DEGSELGVDDRRPRDAKRRDVDLVRPLLVVECEAVALLGAEAVAASRDVDVARERAGGCGARSADDEARRRQIERLARVREGLAMHVLVEQRELVEVRR